MGVGLRGLSLPTRGVKCLSMGGVCSGGVSCCGGVAGGAWLCTGGMS